MRPSGASVDQRGRRAGVMRAARSSTLPLRPRSPCVAGVPCADATTGAIGCYGDTLSPLTRGKTPPNGRSALHAVDRGWPAGGDRPAAAARGPPEPVAHGAPRGGRGLHRQRRGLPSADRSDRRLQRGRGADPRLPDLVDRGALHLPAGAAVRGVDHDRRPAHARGRGADLPARRDRGPGGHRRGRARALAGGGDVARGLPAAGGDRRHHGSRGGGRDLPRPRRARAPDAAGGGREPAQRRDRDRHLHRAARDPDGRPRAHLRRSLGHLPVLVPRRRAASASSAVARS